MPPFEIPSCVGHVSLYLDADSGAWVVSNPRQISPGVFEVTLTSYPSYLDAILAAWTTGRTTAVLH